MCIIVPSCIYLNFTSKFWQKNSPQTTWTSSLVSVFYLSFSAVTWFEYDDDPKGRRNVPFHCIHMFSLLLPPCSAPRLHKRKYNLSNLMPCSMTARKMAFSHVARAESRSNSAKCVTTRATYCRCAEMFKMEAVLIPPCYETLKTRVWLKSGLLTAILQILTLCPSVLLQSSFVSRHSLGSLIAVVQMIDVALLAWIRVETAPKDWEPIHSVFML